MSFYGPLSLQIVLLLLFSLILLNLLTVLKSRNLQDAGARFLAVVLRMPVLVVLAFILLNPVKEEFAGNYSNRKVFLVDKSSSMALGGGLSRYEECMDLLKEGGVMDNQKYKIHYFDSGLGKNESGRPDGNSSQLGKSLDELLIEEKKVGDVIVLSDGAVQDKSYLTGVLRKTIKNRTRISTFVPKVKVIVRNIAIYNCLVDHEVAPASDIPVRLELMVKNFEGKTAEVKISDEKGKLVAQRKLKLKEGLQEVSLKFKAGLRSMNYKLSVSELNGEIHYEDNHFKFGVNVKKSIVRVLYMEGSTDSYYHQGRRERIRSYEFMTEPMIEADDMEVELLLVDVQAVRGGRLYSVNDRSKAFPKTKEELFKYDVVICSDINRSVFTDDQLKWVTELVAERGGGFCMIGGNTSFGSGGWNRTVWEKMIPVDMGTYGPNSHIWSGFKKTFVKEQMNHPILKIVDNEDQNKRILTESYTMLGTNRVKSAKPGATVLAYRQNNSSKMPVIVVQKYGKGRSMAFTSDSAGGWGARYQGSWGPNGRNNDYYKAFWTNVIQWLAANSMSHKRQKLSISLDRLNVYHGDKIGVSVKLMSESPTSFEQCRVYFKGHKDKALFLDKALQKKSYKGIVDILDNYSNGEKVLIVETLNAQGAVTTQEERTVRILDFNNELRYPEADQRYMSEIALATSGSEINGAADLKEILQRKPERIIKKAQPLWDSWPLIIMILGCLSCEWFYRKIHN